ncbi:P2Y purinoceptor 4-like [Pristis pectinata]|uniref:P2Y purinoceptor 4-like n=1 Tax=Pristis pectinata TaxID=685728 RepID=UPI00223D2AEE|nr:P2Y purinoceptor 4-like [Pristis pectinata]XP_051877787.1 P2Y purinoceptor 4-like [Pristis pectinata]
MAGRILPNYHLNSTASISLTYRYPEYVSLQTASGNSTSFGGKNSSCHFDEEFKYILLPVSYGMVCVVGVILNTTALWMFVCKMRPWNVNIIFMFNLAISDLLYVLSLPLLTYYYARRNDWPFGVVLCKITRFIFYANLYSSILFLTCISVHRCLAVCYPIQSLRWIKVNRAWIVCTLVWTSVIICLIPNLIFVTTSRRGDNILCHDTTRREDFPEYVLYSSAIMVILFVIPFFIITICYSVMTRRLSKTHISGYSPASSNVKKKAIKIIIIVLLVFFLCFVPFHITRTMYYTFRVLKKNCNALNIVNFTYKITRPLASINSCIDPILYFLAGDNYRGKFMYATWRRKACVQLSVPNTICERKMHKQSEIGTTSVCTVTLHQGYD